MQIKTTISKLLPTKAYLRIMYRYRMGCWPNLKDPKTFSEKLQFLKLRYEKDKPALYSTMVDKIESKKYVAGILGEEYIIPTLGVYDSFDDIDFDSLPDRFVIKCNHDSGGVVVCPDKSRLDIDKARAKVERCMKQNYYWHGREWPYLTITPKVMVEKYMVDERDGELRDYKFFTFGGVPKLLYITQGRGGGEKTYADFFDMDLNHIDMRIDHENAPTAPHPPKNFELMKELAAKLSEGTPQLRVDFYEVNDKVYFGELTFFHCSGIAKFDPPEWDGILGSWVELPQETVYTDIQ